MYNTHYVLKRHCPKSVYKIEKNITKYYYVREKNKQQYIEKKFTRKTAPSVFSNIKIF